MEIAHRSRRREGAARLLLFAGSLPIALALAEIGARLSGVERRQADSVLGFRMRPDGREIDPRGFRNGPRGLASAEIVAIGDSHTYGVEAAFEDSWPRQLEKLTGRTVYNLGIGGYGPLQYHALLDEALRLRPREILFAIYPANDLVDVCATFLQFEHWRRADTGLSLEYCEAVSALPHFERPSMTSRSSLLNVLRGALEKARQARMRGGPSVAVSVGATRSRLSVEAVRRLVDYVDLGREENARSLAVTERVLERAVVRARVAGAHVGVLLIPLKDSLLAPAVPPGHPEAVLIQDLARKETAVRLRLASFLRAHGIDHVDVSPYLVEALQGPEPVFFETDQRHPQAAGYRAYALAALDMLNRRDPSLSSRENVLP